MNRGEIDVHCANGVVLRGTIIETPTGPVVQVRSRGRLVTVVPGCEPITLPDGRQAPLVGELEPR